MSLTRNFSWKDSLPRIIADLLVVQVSMLEALAVAVLFNMSMRDRPMQDLVLSASRYFSTFLWALLPVFPVAFFLSGFYTTARTVSGWDKVRIICRGVGLAVLAFLGINYVLLHQELTSRAVALPFSVILAVNITLVRYFKSVIASYFAPLRTTVAATQPARDTVLVVGGAGYIGSIVIRKLLTEGRKVRVLDNLTYGDGAIRELNSHPNFELMIGDARNIQNVVSAIRGVDSIILLAAIVGDPACEHDHKSTLEINYAATRMLTEIAKGNGITRLVFASSCSVYGASDTYSDEESPTRPLSLYAKTKIDSEAALLQARTPTFHPTILRLATVFGCSYRQRFDLVVNLLTAKAKQEGVITIYNGEQWRPFIHVHDVASAFVQILNAPLPSVSGQVFNVGDSRINHTLTQVAERVHAEFPDTRVVHENNADRRNYRVSFDKIYKRVGFQATMMLDDGIREMKKVLEEGLVADYKDIYYSNVRFIQATGLPAYTDDTDSAVMAAFAGPIHKELKVETAAV